MLDFKQKLDQLLSDLESKGFIPEEDVAWIPASISQIMETHEFILFCPVREVRYIIYKGIEVRENEKYCKANSLKGWFAWNITGRTKKLFVTKETKDGS